jgi:Holliday junction resolvase
MSSWGAKGSLFERQVKAYYESRGFYVIKSGGSLGAFDLIAIRGADNQSCLGIQCKNRKVRISNTEWNEMLDVAWSSGIEAVLAEKIQGTSLFDLYEPITKIGKGGQRTSRNARKTATITIPKRRTNGQSK